MSRYQEALTVVKQATLYGQTSLVIGERLIPAVTEALALAAALEEVPEDYGWRLTYSWSQKRYRFRAEHPHKIHKIVSGKTPLEALQSALAKMKGDK